MNLDHQNRFSFFGFFEQRRTTKKNESDFMLEHKCKTRAHKHVWLRDSLFTLDSNNWLRHLTCSLLNNSSLVFKVPCKWVLMYNNLCCYQQKARFRNTVSLERYVYLKAALSRRLALSWKLLDFSYGLCLFIHNRDDMASLTLLVFYHTYFSVDSLHGWRMLLSLSTLGTTLCASVNSDVQKYSKVFYICG